MGRKKANKPRRQRTPSRVPADQARAYEDRNRRALCKTCGGDLVRISQHPLGAPTLEVVEIRHKESLHDDDHQAELVWVWDEVECDFCSGHGVLWSYQVLPQPTAARTVLLNPGQPVLDIHRTANDTPWTACGPCGDLIEIRAWDALIQRFVDRVEASGRVVGDFGRQRVAEQHQQFVAMNTGARVPYEA